MAASYPSGIKTFTTKANADVIDASHVNALQDEITAIETDFVTGRATDLLPLVDATTSFGSAAKRWKDAFFSGVLSVAGTLKLRGISYTPPAADATVSGYVLSSDAAGNLSWVAQTVDIPGLDILQIEALA